MFLLIPVGHEETDLNRVPIVTFVIIGLCVLVYGAQHTMFNRQDDMRQYQLLEEIYQYWSIHREELEVPPELHGLLNLYDQQLIVAEEYMEDYIEEQLREHMSEDEMIDDWEEIKRNLMGNEPDSDHSYGGADQEYFNELVGELSGVSEIMFQRRWGFIPSQPSLVSVFTHMFMHGGWMHLLGNMLFLYLTGTVLEDRYGRGFHTAFYLIAGVFSCVMFGLSFASSPVVLVGASGAISAMMGGFLIKYWRTDIRFALIVLIIFRLKFFNFKLPAWLVLPIWFMLQLGDAVLSNGNTGGGVAYLAHVWGFVFGAGVCYGLKASGLEQRYFPEIINLDDAEHDVMRHALKEERLGRRESALGILRKASRENPDDLDVLQNYWRLAMDLGRPQDMVISGQKLMQKDIDAGEIKMAYVRWKELVESAPEALIPAAFTTRLAEELVGAQYYVEAEDILSYSFRHLGPGTTNQVLMHMLEVAADMGNELGTQIADRLKQQSSFNEHEKLEELMARLERRAAGGGPDEAVAMTSFSGGLELSDAHEFQGFDKPTKNVHSLKTYPCVPQKLMRTGIQVLVGGKHGKVVQYATIKVIAVGAVREPGQKPVLIIDLVFDTLYDVLEHHRVLRLTSTGFNPMSLIPNQANPGAAFKRLIQILLMKSGAEGLPNASAVSGNPYANFNSVKAYERAVYFD